MSSILDKIRESLNKSKTQEKESKRVEQKPSEKNRDQTKSHHHSTTLVPKNKSSKIKIIQNKDELPGYVSVMTYASSGVIIPEEDFRKYAILITSPENKEIVILCSTETESYLSNEPDMNWHAITQEMGRSGYRRRTQKIFASPAIIDIVYDNEKARTSSEDHKRRATKIQLDFDDLLREATAQDVSDIHIEVRKTQAKVRFRKNGDMIEFQEWSVTHARTMAGVIYQVIAAEKDTSFDESRPQDALIDRNLDGNQLRVRLATIPAYPSGFDMIMRLLKVGQDGKRQSLNELGYEKSQLTSIRRAVSKPVGAVIMSGTTGSGKSTSLNSMLGEKIDLNRGRIKVITVEDPPEYALPGATQVPVVRSRSKAQTSADENPFAAVVRAAMRSDPDILMVGEVRDESSAELLIHSVQSGHQVFTTVHAGSGIDIISRLRSNGIPDDVLGGQNFISALMYQSLIPILCEKCGLTIKEFSEKVNTDQEQDCLDRIYKYVKPSLIDSLRFENTDGDCPHCSMGRIGRSVASEVILPDAYMLSCFRNKQDTDALMHYRRKGGKIALEHGMLKVLKGRVDIRQVETKLDQITALEELYISLLTFDKQSIAQAKPFQIDETVFDEIPPLGVVPGKVMGDMPSAFEQSSPAPSPISMNKYEEMSSSGRLSAEDQSELTDESINSSPDSDKNYKDKVKRSSLLREEPKNKGEVIRLKSADTSPDDNKNNKPKE